jgi:hypothetical protein
MQRKPNYRPKNLKIKFHKKAAFTIPTNNRDVIKTKPTSVLAMTNPQSELRHNLVSTRILQQYIYIYPCVPLCLSVRVIAMCVASKGYLHL